MTTPDKNIKKILFVCTGNTCRSPMAEAFMNAAIENNPKLKNSYKAASAGIAAFPGAGASAHSVDVMSSEWKIDISGHMASQLDEASVDEAFLILAMTRHQKDYILSQYSGAAGKTYTLKEFVKAQSTHDITDPFGWSIDVYSRCAQEIKEAVDLLADIIARE